MDDAGEKVIDLIFGRWRSQILYTGVKLGVFDALASGPKNAARDALQHLCEGDQREAGP